MNKIILLFSTLFLLSMTQILNAQCTNSVTDTYCYDSDQTQTLIGEYCPNAGETMEILFVQFDMETNFDFIEVFEGTAGSGTGGTLLGTFDDANPGLIVASAADLCISVYVTSDNSVSCQTSIGPITIQACPQPSPTCTTCADPSCPIEDIIGTAEANLPNGYPAGTTPIFPPLTQAGETATVCANVSVPAGVGGSIGLDAFLSVIDAGEDNSIGFTPAFQLYDNTCTPIAPNGSSPMFNLPTYDIGGAVVAGGDYVACVTYTIDGTGPGDEATAIQFAVWGETYTAATCGVDTDPFGFCYEDDFTDQVVLEICPQTAGEILELTIDAGTVEPQLDGITCWDELAVYSGAAGSGTSGTDVTPNGGGIINIIGGACGDFAGQTITAANAGDCIIFVMNSDGSNNCVDVATETAFSISCPAPLVCDDTYDYTTAASACHGTPIDFLLEPGCDISLNQEDLTGTPGGPAPNTVEHLDFDWYFYFDGTTAEAPAAYNPFAAGGNAGGFDTNFPISDANLTNIGGTGPAYGTPTCSDFQDAAGWTNEGCAPYTVTYFMIPWDIDRDSDNDNTFGEYNDTPSACPYLRYDVVIYPDALTTNVVDDGTTCSTPSIELLSADGTVCATQTKAAACADDNDSFDYDFASDVPWFGNEPATCTQNVTLSGTINCSNCGGCNATHGGASNLSISGN